MTYDYQMVDGQAVNAAPEVLAARDNGFSSLTSSALSPRQDYA